MNFKGLQRMFVMGSHEDDGGCIAARRNGRGDIDAIAIGHGNIQQHDIRPAALDSLEYLLAFAKLAAGFHGHLAAGVFKESLESRPGGRLVVDDERAQGTQLRRIGHRTLGAVHGVRSTGRLRLSSKRPSLMRVSRVASRS